MCVSVGKKQAYRYDPWPKALVKSFILVRSNITILTPMGQSPPRVKRVMNDDEIDQNLGP